MTGCYFCNKPATGACAECREVDFCSRACLGLAWRHGGHAEVCRLRKEHMAGLVSDTAAYDAGTVADHHAAVMKDRAKQQQEREKRLKEAIAVQEARRKARLELLEKLKEQQRAGSRAQAYAWTEWLKLVARVEMLDASERPLQWDTARATRAFDGLWTSAVALWNRVNDADAVARTVPVLMEHTETFLDVFGVGASVRAVDTAEALQAVRAMHVDQMAQLIVDHALGEGARLNIDARNVNTGRVSTATATTYFNGNDGGDTALPADANPQPEWLQSEEATREHDRFVSARLDQAVSQIDENDADTRAFIMETRRDVAKKVSAMSGSISNRMYKFLLIESKEVIYGLLLMGLVGTLFVLPGRLIVGSMDAAGQAIVNDVTQIGDIASVAMVDVNEANDKLKPVITLLEGKLKEVQAATDAATSLATDFVSGTISLAPTTDNVSLLGSMLDTFREESIANFMSDGTTRAEAMRQFLVTNRERLEIFDKLKSSLFEKDKASWLADWAFLNKNLTMTTSFTKPREIGIYLTPLQALFALDSLKFASATLDKVGHRLSDLRGLAEKARAKMDEYRDQVAKYRTRSPVSVYLSSLMARATGSGTTEAGLLLWYSNDALLRFQQLEEHFNVVMQLSSSALSGALAGPFAFLSFLNVVGRTATLLSSMVAPAARLLQGIVASFEKALVYYYGEEFPKIAAVQNAIGRGARYLEKGSSFLTILTSGLYLVKNISSVVSSLATIMVVTMGFWGALLMATVTAALTVGTIIALLVYQKTRSTALGFISWFGRFVINYHYILAPVLAFTAFIMQTVYANNASLDGAAAAAAPVDVPHQHVNPEVSLADLKVSGRVLGDELKSTHDNFMAYASGVSSGAVKVKSVPEAFEWAKSITGMK